MKIKPSPHQDHSAAAVASDHSAGQKERYQTALAELVASIQEDRTILAAILCGSLSYDEVWEKSDIDLLLVATEDLKTAKHLTLLADGISVHAMIWPRAKFKVTMGRATQSSFFHSLFSRSTLLFTKDESLLDLYENFSQIGARDREIQRLSFALGVLGGLTKTEKWYLVKRDWHYAFFYLMKCLDGLAGVEVVGQGEIAGREVIAQAEKHNPAFFGKVYHGLIDGPKNEATIGAAVAAIYQYLDERPEIFRPLLDYLNEAGGPRSSTEMDHYFEHNFGLEGASFACEWLAGRGVVECIGTPVRLVEKSRVTVDEASYYYSRD